MASDVICRGAQSEAQLLMKIAILGTRGIPNRYGGFEAFAENLSRKLADRGHEVTVYCRRPFTRPGDEKLIDARVRRVVLPSIAAKHLDTPINTLLAAVYASFTRAEVVLMVNSANSPVAWIPRLFGKPVILNVDGLDRTRRKWGRVAGAYLHFCEWLSLYAPTRVVTDAEAIRSYYRARYNKETAMIGYGAEIPAGPTLAKSAQAPAESVLQQFHLQPRRYVLYVTRLEPENNPELVLNAYRQTKTDWPLVIVGSNAYKPEYERELRALTKDDERVLFTGAIYGPGYWELQRNAGIFIFAGEVGGIHPALIETMAAGNAALYLDTESNRETAGDAGLAFNKDVKDLSSKLARLLDDASLRERLRKTAAQRARECYSWDEIATKYEELMRSTIHS
jgi:glycosyltransferase involved in cell wall biosynthesis